MFWRFTYQNGTSNMENVLAKEGLTLDDLFAEDELLQEVKGHNTKLIDFLCKPDIRTRLVSTLISDDLDETKKFKYPYLACEVIACEVGPIVEGIVSDQELLSKLWEFLDRPAPLNSLQASYFCKANVVLIQRKMFDMLAFIKSQPNIIDRFLNHIGNASVAELLLKILNIEDQAGRSPFHWFCRKGLVPKLVDRLDPNLDVEIHNTASQTILDVIAVSYQYANILETSAMNGNPVPELSDPTPLVDQLKSEEITTKMMNYMLDNQAPNVTSTLANCINIIIELIRRYCSEIEQAEYQQHQLQQTGQNQWLPPAKFRALATDLIELLKAIGTRVPEMAELLKTPRTAPLSRDESTVLKPLGMERLKSCELFAEILHLQYLYFSSPLFDKLMTSQPIPVPEFDANATAPPTDVVQAPTSAEVKPTESTDTNNETSNETNTSTEVAAAPPASVAAPASTETDDEFSAPPEPLSIDNDEFSAPPADGSADVDALAMNMAQLGVVDDFSGPMIPSAGAVRSSKPGNVGEELVAVTRRFVDAGVLPMCMSLFFEHPWNNFLHSVVYDMIAKVFNTYSFTAPMDYSRLGAQTMVMENGQLVPGPEPMELDPNGAELSAKMDGIKESFRTLVLSILKEGDLTTRIVQAQKQNDEEEARNKGARLGYMGHLTYIADEVCKLLEKCAADFVEADGATNISPEWEAYVNGALNETRERDRKFLGGGKPDGMGGVGGHGYSMVGGMGSAAGSSGMLDDPDIAMSLNSGAGVVGDEGEEASGGAGSSFDSDPDWKSTSNFD